MIHLTICFCLDFVKKKEQFLINYKFYTKNITKLRQFVEDLSFVLILSCFCPNWTNKKYLCCFRCDKVQTKIRKNLNKLLTIS